MRKLILTTLSIALLSGSIFIPQSFLAQGNGESVAERHAAQKHLGVRQGETLEYCTTHWKMEEMFEKSPAMKLLYEKRQIALERETEAFLKDKSSNPEAKAGTVYTIPVVFHILHQNGLENISSDQVNDAIAILTRDFRLNNADATSVVAAFSGVPGDAEIEFALATKAPDGTCFNGITRTNSYLSYDGSDGGDQVQAVVDGNDVYNGNWPGDEYLNIFVAADIGGAAGYTTNPGFGSGMTSGIWVQHTYVGSIETGNIQRSRTLTHEVGHWLNLSHPWGGSNNPGLSSNCGIDDGVLDTPTCIGVTVCSTTSNTCTDDNAYWGFNQIDNVENYMDYSYCSKMFTPGQISRMRTALMSSTGGRSNIWTTANLNAVGANGAPLTLCRADFNADEYEICSGDSIQFTDYSYNNVTGWTWTFSGGSPASSTAANPKIEYATPGTYTVTLQVTDGSANVSTTKTGFITVLPKTGRVAPFTEGFEAISSIPTPEWFVANQDGGGEWEITTAAAATGSKSIFVDNSTANSGSDDSFISNTINLNLATAVTLNFKYAFAKTNSSNSDKLEVWASSNCGDSWALRKNISSAAIATAPDQGGNFVPSASEWKSESITNINSTYWTENFRFKIVYKGGGGNNIYLDDINIDAVMSIEDQDVIQNLNIYPNPLSDYSNIEFNLIQNADVSVEMFDMVGKLISNDRYSNLSSGMHKLNLDARNIGTGIYLVKLRIGDTEVTRRVIVD
ncbi:MAG: PKD repeat protein [Parvicellaceae bacterium]|jgi:PKD repeat protein